MFGIPSETSSKSFFHSIAFSGANTLVHEDLILWLCYAPTPPTILQPVKPVYRISLLSSSLLSKIPLVTDILALSKNVMLWTDVFLCGGFPGRLCDIEDWKGVGRK